VIDLSVEDGALQRTSKQHRVARWKLLVGLSGIMFIVTGLGLTPLGVYLEPIQATFHLSATEMFILPVISQLGMYALGPLLGWLMERKSARLIVAIGATAAATGYFLAGFSNSFDQLAFCISVAALGVGASTLIPCMTLATRWFPRDFSFAMGWLVAAYAIGGAVTPPILASLVSQFGWRFTMECSGLVLLATAVPIIIFLVSDRPGDTNTAAQLPDTSGGELPLELPAAGSHSLGVFFGITTMLSLAALSVNGVSYAFIPFGVDLHFDLTTDGAMLGLVNAFSALGCIAAGILAGRLGVRRVLFAALAGNAICMALPVWIAVHSPDAKSLLALVIVFGFVQSVPSQLGPVILAMSVGEHSFGKLSGTMMLVVGIVGAISPVAVGWIHDATGSYIPAMLACAGCMILTLPLVYASRPPTSPLTGVRIKLPLS
jgi:MFS family permease